VTRLVTGTAPPGGDRLDVAVAAVAGVTRSRAARLIDAGRVRVDGVALPRSARVPAGALIEVELAEEPARPEPEGMPLRIVHQDRWLAVVSKPAGVVMHPAPGHPSGTLVNALLARLGRSLPGEPDRPGIVHRLDAGTSGLVVVALEETAHAGLRAMLAARQVSRRYLALVEGAPPASGTVDAPIGRSPRNRKKMAVVAGGREAVTDFRRLERHHRTALLEVRPRTGRTHQIRVHLAEAGHPVVGDRVYGRDRRLAAALGLARPFLHAAGLAFRHPVTGEALSFEDPLPEDLVAALEAARRL
jgi:23S rRNA pseudouridine1911/1915/1917 synthase